MNQELNKTEVAALAECEAAISAGQQSFIEVGQALCRIRDERLYRATYSSFATYCEEKWGWTSRRSQQLMQAAEVVSQMSNVKNANHGSHLPTTERQARELAKVEPAKRAEVIKKAAATGKVTAKSIAKAAAPAPVAAPDPAPLIPYDKQAEALAEHLRREIDGTFEFNRETVAKLAVECRETAEALANLARKL